MTKLTDTEFQKLVDGIVRVVSSVASELYTQNGHVGLLPRPTLARLTWRQSDDGGVTAVPVDDRGNTLITHKLGSADPMSIPELIGHIKQAKPFGFGMHNALTETRGDKDSEKSPAGTSTSSPRGTPSLSSMR